MATQNAESIGRCQHLEYVGMGNCRQNTGPLFHWGLCSKITKCSLNKAHTRFISAVILRESILQAKNIHRDKTTWLQQSVPWHVQAHWQVWKTVENGRLLYSSSEANLAGKHGPWGMRWIMIKGKNEANTYSKMEKEGSQSFQLNWEEQEIQSTAITSFNTQKDTACS